MANNTNFGGAGGIALNGAEDIWIKMAKVGKVVADKLNKRAVTRALKPVVIKARELAPVGKGLLAGTLRDSVGSIITSKKGVVTGVVGPIRKRTQIGTRKKGKKKGSAIIKDPARYAPLAEFGTSHSAPRPFLRPAWETVGAEKALDTYTKDLSEGLDAEVAKLK